MQFRAMPVSRLSTEAPAVVDELSEGAGPVVLTVDGEARAVLQDIADYERDQRALAILKLAAYGRKEQEEGAVLEADEAFAALDAAIYGEGEAEPTT